MSKEGFCKSCGDSPSEYKDFDYNIEEEYGVFPAKEATNYYNMSGNNQIYNSAEEAKGSPMGIPIGHNGTLPCQSANYTQGYRENYVNKLPSTAPYWSKSYFSYVGNMPANTRLTVQDPDNPISFKFGGPQWQNFRC